MNKWKFKSCSRCGGDLLIERGEYGWYEHCLQCGYEHDLKNITELEERGNKIGKQPIAAGR